MKSILKFLKSSAIYFVGNVLMKVVTFLLLPIYTEYISPADMGYFDLTNTYIYIIGPVICMEIWSGIMRYMFDYNEKDGKYKAVFNGFLIFSCSLLLFTVGTLILGAVKDVRYLLLIFIFGICNMLHTLYTYIVRGLGYNAVFAASGILGSFVNAASNIIMILVFDMRLDSLYIAMILGFAAQIILMECKIKLWKHMSFKMLDVTMIKSMIRFSFPLALNSACFWFLSSYNKVGISSILGLEVNGIYSTAAKFTSVLSLVSGCFSMAWQEMAYGLGNDKENKSLLYTTASNYYLKFLMYGTVVIIPAVSVIFPILIDPSYKDAYPLVPLYLLATVASIFSGFLGNIFSAEKKTGVIFTSTVAAAVINVALFHILVGTLGAQAANISLLCGFIVNIILRVILLRKIYKIKIDYKMLIFTTALSAASIWIYMTQSRLINLVALLGFGIITLIAFRKILLKGVDMVKSKLGKGKKSEES